MKANKIFDCMYTRPFAEDDALLNDFVDRTLHDVSWRLFERQDDICEMATENHPPILKEGAVDIIRQEFRTSLSWLVGYMVDRILIEYCFSNIDLDAEAEWYLREDLGEDEWEDFEKSVREYIYNDYAKHLGVEKANEYFKRIGREDWIIE